MDATTLLNKLIEKQNLTTEESQEFLADVMNGVISPVQIGAILTALRMKGETPQEIIGFIQAMRKQMVAVSIQDAIDVCGTGGDGTGSFNISTATAFVVVGCGVPVAKHGNRAASSKCGSADVLENLGVTIQLDASQAKTVFDKVGMVFLFAPLFHPATKQVVLVRRELKIRTIFNFLGPFLSPASVTKQLIGVPNVDVAKKLIEVAKQLGYHHLLLATSEDGMDEVSLSAKTHIFELKDNQENHFIIDPTTYGFKTTSADAIAGGDVQQNAQAIHDVLNGVKDEKRDIVLLNSAVALYTADKVKSIEEGITKAAEAIDTGAAKKVLENLIKETQVYA